jgi:uncharacterized membrane protein
MLLCPYCDVQLPERAVFCPQCGGPIRQTEAQPAAEVAAPVEVVTEAAVVAADSGAPELSPDAGLPIPENIAGVVAYITIIPAVVFLFLEPFKRNYFIRFHAFQHLFLWVAGFVIAVVAGILSALMQLIPFMRVLVFPLGGLITLAWFFLWVLLVVKAYHHELFKLPIIGDLAEQQAGA